MHNGQLGSVSILVQSSNHYRYQIQCEGFVKTIICLQSLLLHKEKGEFTWSFCSCTYIHSNVTNRHAQTRDGTTLYHPVMLLGLGKLGQTEFYQCIVTSATSDPGRKIQFYYIVLPLHCSLRACCVIIYPRDYFALRPTKT